MADGTQKPISEVRVGDWVLASDPERGRTQAKQVTDVIVGSGYKQLKRVVAAGRQIVATDEHPFYTANDRSWTDAADLRQGDQLQAVDGRLVAVSAIVDADRAATVYNLTVDDLHTYYAGTLPLLVHNTNGCPTGAATDATKAGTRLAQDIGVNPNAPAVLSTTRSIGRASHTARLQDDIAALPGGATDIRVNQQQVNALGQRVGINRPDLQYTLNGKRHYVEYEGPGNPRGAAHRARIFANDPSAAFDLRIVP